MIKKMKQMPREDRPREKLIRRGAGALSDTELLAILIGSGTRSLDVMGLANKLSMVIDRAGMDIKPEDLKDLEGLGPAKITLLLAALEFARRRIKPEGIKIEKPADLLPHIRHYADRKQEHFLCATVNGANEIINIRVVTIGLVDQSPVHPREVYADALVDRASGIIVAHNHPSGPLRPSASDTEITKQLVSAGKIIGVCLLDHIIFNRQGFYSFLEDGSL